MSNSFFQSQGIGKVGDITGRIQNNMGDMGLGQMQTSPMKLDALSETPTTDFKGVMSGLAQNLNQQMNAPDQLLKASMNGSSDVDIHDVMTAMAKAEISFNVATQVTTKVIQAYDKIMQISV